MYIIHHQYNNTKIIMPDTQNKLSAHVSEIGYNSPPAGYTPVGRHRNCYILHYLVTGKGTYYGYNISGPCVFLLDPEHVHFYKVDPSPDSPRWKQYWMILSGEGAKELLEDAGVSGFPYTAPCPYINHVVDIFANLPSPTSFMNNNDHFYTMSGLFQLLSLHSASQQNLSKKSKHTDVVAKICNYIQDNYSSISNEEQIAQSVYLSTNHMHRIFKSEMGITPIDYLNAHRIRCAKKLLKNTDISLNYIAEMLGFSSANYLCTVFKKYCNGISPSEYRKRFQ